MTGKPWNTKGSELLPYACTSLCGPSGGGLVARVEAVPRRRRPDVVRVGLARLGADSTDKVVRQARAVVVRVVYAQAVEGRGARLLRREKLLHLGQKCIRLAQKMQQH
jgi:hypothetical protein